ncbi:MAG: hypothetical protein ACI8Y9_000709, partial [Paracoccaceae bacterium]
MVGIKKNPVRLKPIELKYSAINQSTPKLAQDMNADAHVAL